MLHEGTMTGFTVGRYRRKELLATWGTVRMMMEEAWQGATWGNDGPVLIRMGKLVEGLMPRTRGWRAKDGFYCGAVVLRGGAVDEAEFYRWDRGSYDRPILFVAAVVKVVEEGV